MMKSTLLVVEDDEAILHLIDVALTLSYYKVIKVTPGIEVEYRISKEHNVIILLDVGLPDIFVLRLFHSLKDFV